MGALLGWGAVLAGACVGPMMFIAQAWDEGIHRFGMALINAAVGAHVVVLFFLCVGVFGQYILWFALQVLAVLVKLAGHTAKRCLVVDCAPPREEVQKKMPRFAETLAARSARLPLVGRLRPVTRLAVLVALSWAVASGVEVATWEGLAGLLVSAMSCLSAVLAFVIHRTTTWCFSHFRGMPFRLVGRAAPVRGSSRSGNWRGDVPSSGSAISGIVRQGPTSLSAPLSGARCVAFRLRLVTTETWLDDALVVPFLLESDDGQTYAVTARDIVIDADLRAGRAGDGELAKLKDFLASRALAPADIKGHRLAEAALCAGDRVTIVGLARDLPEVQSLGFRGKVICHALVEPPGEPLCVAASRAVEGAVRPTRADAH